MNLAPRPSPDGLQALPDGLLWGRTVRPPAAAWDGRRYTGATLESTRREAVERQAGVVAVVQDGQFLGVVAVSDVYARQAASDLAPVWRTPAAAPEPPPPGPADYRWRIPAFSGGIDDGASPPRLAVWCLGGQVGVWLAPAAPALLAALRQELARLLSVAPPQIRFHEIAGALAGRPLEVVDAACDAAWLSRAVDRPVGVVLMAGRAGPALVLRLAEKSQSGAVVPANDAAAAPLPTLHADTPWAVRPGMARLLGRPSAESLACPSAVADGPVLGDGSSAALVDAGIDDLDAAQVFAQESLWHEQALARGEDPLAWRLRHLPAGTGAALARQVVAGAGWTTPLAPSADGSLRGRGFATARVARDTEDGAPEVLWSAWVAEVAVHPRTGEVEVLRVVAGQDSESLQPARSAPVARELSGQDPLLLDSARQLFARPDAFDDWKVPEMPQMPLAVPQASAALAHGRLRTDGVLGLPAAAAIANAIQDATGVRLRQVPFDAEQLRRSLGGGPVARPPGRLRRGASWIAVAAAGIAGLAAIAWPVKSALPLTDGPDLSMYSAQAIERGRLVAAAGDCVVCHTAPGGRPNAGGLPLDTPFGTVYSTNITPDPDTGIGRWSHAAFERAMRQGIHQDGRHLYPAFPYTAFAKMSDGDIQSLYAYLMSAEPVAARAPQTRMDFPYNIRASLAGWNLLFHDATPFKADPARTAEWNRGAYLVDGAGHCSACHSPRNALGAEKNDLRSYLSGGTAEGWTAPALNRLAGGATPWSRQALEQYLATGFSPRHGVAAGPMAPVIHGLAQLPPGDIAAITTYLLDLPGMPAPAAPDLAETALAPVPVPTPPIAVAAPTALRHLEGERIFQNACAACHATGGGPTLFGARPDLSANTNLHSATPDNLVRTILHGIQNPASGELGYMPGFGDSLDDRQVAELLGYLRARFAPAEPPWPADPAPIRHIRAQPHP